jgi:hypothetical protein
MCGQTQTEVEMAHTEDAPALGSLKPYAVPIKTAQELLGRKARSDIYEAIGRGELDVIKDGAKTLIVLASIERRQANLPRGLAKPPAKATRAQRKRRGPKSGKTAAA